jgi:hypothetical protein
VLSGWGGIEPPHFMQATFSRSYSFKTCCVALHAGHVRACFFFNALDIAVIWIIAMT